MTRRPIILLDVDGVLADFTGATLDFLRTIGVDRQPDHVTAFAIEDALGLSSAQRARMKARWSEPGFCASIPVYEGAVAGVERLRGIGDVYAVTAAMWSSPTWQHERTEWLVRHFDFRRQDVISTHAKHLVIGDVLVDDKPEHVEAWTHGQAFCWARPYNEEFIGLRTSDWRVIAGAAAMRTARSGG